MRRPKPDHDGQNVLWAAGRTRRVRRGGRRQNAETALVRACLDWAALHPGIVPRAWRNNAGIALLRSGGAMALAPQGSPDIVGFLADGRFLGVECKLAGNEPTTEQVEWLTAIAEAGGVAIVAHSVEELAEDIRSAASRTDWLGRRLADLIADRPGRPAREIVDLRAAQSILAHSTQRFELSPEGG